MLQPGAILENNATRRKYRVIKELGHGGFGVTYECICLANGKQAALKELFPEGVVVRAANGAVMIIGDVEAYNRMRESFLKEAKILSELNDVPSVVSILDYFYTNNTAYYVMEYIEGSTLLQYISARGLLSAAQFEEQFRQLMRDIDCLHKHGVIHRDISPDNIMFAEDGSFKLIDFGSARAYNKGLNLTANLKRNFAPLEQYSLTGQGPYTDVYALASTMYFSFTGKLIPDAVERLEKKDFVLPSVYGAKLTPKQEQALVKALEIRKESRFQTMQEFEYAFYGPPPIKPVKEEIGIPKLKSTDSSVIACSRLISSLTSMEREPVLPLIGGVFLLAAIAMQLIL